MCYLIGVRTVPVPHRPDGSCTTGPVPVPFRPHSSYLDGRWTGRSRPVQDRRCTSVTAVQTGGRVSPNFLRVKFFNFYNFTPIDLFHHRSSSLVLVVCPVAAVRFTSRNRCSPNLSSRLSFLTSRSSPRTALCVKLKIWPLSPF